MFVFVCGVCGVCVCVCVCVRVRVSVCVCVRVGRVSGIYQRPGRAQI